MNESELHQVEKSYEIRNTRRAHPLIVTMAAQAAATLLPSIKPREAKGNCLNCRKPKYHNNSFCSAECCREFRK